MSEVKEVAPSAKKESTVIKKVEYGSRVVFLRRKELSSHLPKEVRADAKATLSSVFKNRQPLKGFDSVADEKKYLGTILDVSPDDKEWSRYVRKFWAELRVKVSFAGVPLEIGKDEEGNPLNLIDFIHYNFATRHPLVAESAEGMKKWSKSFYIQDPKREEKAGNNAVKTGKLADREFIKISEDTEAMKNVLRVMSPGLDLSSLSGEKIENVLYGLKQSKAKEFLLVVGDKDLTLRAELYNMLTKNVLQKIGNSIVYMDETIGTSMDDAIRVLKEQRNSSKLHEMRVRLKES